MALDNRKTTVGIVGLGSFGRFAASVLAKDMSLDVMACDNRHIDEPEGVRIVTFDEVASADVIVLCVPLRAYDDALTALRPRLTGD
jgi:phosphoglycerate dehydrogenase-like enzyme